MMILTEGMNLEDVPAVVDRMGAEAETVDRAAEAPEMAVRMVVGQADGDRIHGDQAVVAQADLVQWDLQDHGDHRDFPDTRGPRVRQEPPGRPVPKGRQERQELQDRRVHKVRQARLEQLGLREQPAHKAPRAQKVQGARPVLRDRLVRREPSHRQQLLTMPPAQKTL